MASANNFKIGQSVSGVFSNWMTIKGTVSRVWDFSEEDTVFVKDADGCEWGFHYERLSLA